MLTVSPIVWRVDAQCLPTNLHAMCESTHTLARTQTISMQLSLAKRIIIGRAFRLISAYARMRSVVQRGRQWGGNRRLGKLCYLISQCNSKEKHTDNTGLAHMVHTAPLAYIFPASRPGQAVRCRWLSTVVGTPQNTCVVKLGHYWHILCDSGMISPPPPPTLSTWRPASGYVRDTPPGLNWNRIS